MAANLSGRPTLGFPGKVAVPVGTGENRGLENMPKIRDNQKKALNQMKMVEHFRKTNGKVAPRNRHGIKQAAMARKKAGPPMKKNFTGSIG